MMNHYQIPDILHIHLSGTFHSCISVQGRLYFDRAIQAMQREYKAFETAKRKLNRKIEYSIETVKVSI